MEELQKIKDLIFKQNELVKELEIAITEKKNASLGLTESQKLLNDKYLELMTLHDTLKEREKKIKNYIEYDKIEEAVKGLMQSYSDFKKKVDSEHAQLEQKKVDFLKWKDDQLKKVERSQQELDEKWSLLRKQIDEFNEWKKKYGKIEEFIPF